MTRRTVLKFLASLLAWAPFGRRARARPVFGAADRASMIALAAAVLPSEIGAAGRERAVAAFMQWVRDYRTGAELDHGYGLTQLHTAPPSPARGYPAQFEDLERRCGGRLGHASLADRQRAVTQALMAAKVQALPERPDGVHIATDLMAHYFNGPDANDLVHGRLIGRLACRGLPGSDERPPPLQRESGAPR